MEFVKSASTVCTDLAACLCTLGIARHPERPLEVLVGDAEQIAFYFVGGSPCGTYQAEEMIKAWSDRNFPNARPKHPLTYMRTALLNRSVLLDYAHSSKPCGIVARSYGARFSAVHIEPGHVCPLQPLRLAADAPANDSLRTESIELASALLACGIPLWSPLPVTRAAGRLTFFFSSADQSGMFPAGALMRAWREPEWYLAHPEHPLAYIYCAMENRRRLLAEIKSHGSTVCIMQRNGMPAFLSLHAEPALEKKFFHELNQY